MAAPGAVEERRLVDDVGARGHRLDRLGGRGAQLVALVRDRAIELDGRRRPAVGQQVREEARLVLEAALADDVELRVVAHRSLDQTGQRGAFELGQVLAGEVGDEIGGGVDRSAVDASARLHRSGWPCQLACHGARYALAMPVAATRRRRARARSDRPGRASSSARSARRWTRARSRPAVPGSAAADRGRLGRRRVGDGPSDASQRRRGAALDRVGQGGPPPAGPARRADRRPRRTTARAVRGAADLTALVGEINRAIARVNAEAPTDRQHRRPLDLEAELARLDEPPDRSSAETSASTASRKTVGVAIDVRLGRGRRHQGHVVERRHQDAPVHRPQVEEPLELRVAVAPTARRRSAADRA